MKTISGTELRDRLLARMSAVRVESHEDWLQVISVSGNQELMSLIGRYSPNSVSELAELAGRRQPNVSRSLSALVGAGLVEVRTEGRRSIPMLTPLGREKSENLQLIESGAAVDPGTEDRPEPALLSFETDGGGAPAATELPLASTDVPQDELPGKLLVWLRLRGESQRRIASHSGDLNAVALHVVDNWWRILHRRDSPFRLCDLTFDGDSNPFSISVSSVGRRMELLTRAHDGVPVMLDDGDRWLKIEKFEDSLLNEFLSPLARCQRSLGRLDRPLQDRLERLLDSRASASEASYCKTAGALGLSPYNLAEEMYERVRRLMEIMPDEESRLDFSSAVLADALQEGQEWTLAELQGKGAANVLPGLRELRQRCLTVGHNRFASRPWERGTNLARATRAELGLEADVSIGGPKGLARLFGADDELRRSPEAPGSLRAFQACHDGLPTVIVEDEGDRRTSFILARAVGDYLAYGNQAACVADLYTDRQAVGRAFAAEFMAPAAGVVNMMEAEDRSRVQIAAHYGVTPGVVSHQYDNNRMAA
ncbi:MAG TPA: ArsR family transcriptional regulator [Allosphingosinicella sp.]|jgi:DNA-binding MarR family transcriptional regulator|nr:ArsR family transcriptional regulator [Allosphingosinicella sp.]